MNCEICNSKAAETAISVVKNGVEDELYVCRDCARKEKVARQKKASRTRRIEGLPPGMSMSITKISEGDAPPFIKGLMSAIEGMFSDLKHSDGESGEPDGDESAEPAAEEKKAPKMRRFPCERVDHLYRIGDLLHLEGLFLIGEIEAVRRAVAALGMSLDGIAHEGIGDAGHAYSLNYSGTAAQAKRIVKEIINQERNARVRLYEEMPRVLGDSVCRALAILKNCRLLSPGELFDLLSPLRIAAIEEMLEGITYDEVESLLASEHVEPHDLQMSVPERDRLDEERADMANERFADVVLSERGEEKFQ